MPRICKITLLDEVNIQISGIDDKTLKKAADTVTFTVPNSRFMPGFSMGWNGKKSLIDRRNGNSFRHLLPKILPPIVTAGYEIEIVDQRANKIEFHVPLISNNLFEGYEYGQFQGVMEDHQVDAINSLTQNGSGLLLLATAGGKTAITAGLTQLYYQFGKVLIIVPRQDLALETKDMIRAMGMEDCGTFFDEHRDPRHVTITTWQSLEIVPELFQDVTTLICDECHGADAKVLFKLLSQAGNNVPVRFGMTGTLPKDDLSKNNIQAALGPVVYVKRAKELQDIGFLAKCQIFILKYLDRKRPEYLAVMGDHQYYSDECRWQFESEPRIHHIAEFIKAIKQDGNTLVLVRYRDYGQKLHELIPGSIYLNGDAKGEHRQRIYRQVNETDDNTLICTYGIASTGINIPRLFNMILIEPGKESVSVIQSIGRMLRRARDKTMAVIYHIGSDCKFSRKHLSEVQGIYKENEYPFEIVEVDY